MAPLIYFFIIYSEKAPRTCTVWTHDGHNKRPVIGAGAPAQFPLTAVRCDVPSPLSKKSDAPYSRLLPNSPRFRTQKIAPSPPLDLPSSGPWATISGGVRTCGRKDGSMTASGALRTRSATDCSPPDWFQLAVRHGCSMPRRHRRWLAAAVGLHLGVQQRKL